MAFIGGAWSNELSGRVVAMEPGEGKVLWFFSLCLLKMSGMLFLICCFLDDSEIVISYFMC